MKKLLKYAKTKIDFLAMIRVLNQLRIEYKTRCNSSTENIAKMLVTICRFQYIKMK